MVPFRNQNQTDKKQGLFSDRSAKPCPQQIPSYAGTPSEYFITFKDKFNRAAEDNRISKTDQLEKLLEALTGNAASRIPPDGVASVDSAWSFLEKAFRDPLKQLNFRLGTIKANQPLSDKDIETDPNKAAIWFLEFENAIESILRLGDSTTSLRMQCFNAATIYQIYKRLPYTIQYQTYGLEEDGREKLGPTPRKEPQTRTTSLIKPPW